MLRRAVWLMAMGMGLVAAGFLMLSGPGASRAGASPSQLCIGSNGTFVTCGQPGQGSVLPTTPTTTGGAPTYATTPAPKTAAPTTADPTTARKSPARVASQADAVHLTHGEDGTVVVVGTLAAIVLLAELIAVTVLRPGDGSGAGGGPSRGGMRSGA